MEHDVEEIQQRLEAVKMKLTGEMKVFVMSVTYYYHFYCYVLLLCVIYLNGNNIIVVGTFLE